MMSIRKSQFLREEHGRMEQEAVASRWVNKLRHQLESACRESQDRAAEAMGARATKLRAFEREFDVAKAHLAETEAALQKSLEALEAEWKARSDTEQEVVMLRGQLLGAEESNA